ncbi:response regulator [Erythrobacter sp. NFXS35]|uniref:response regulator n=1 Tax=Erythrobacter sp. NFXS35 TaxID=2818436 RepID=UPI0032DF82C5
MSNLPLQGCRVLVVEDEFLLADELRGELEQAGAEVVGPIGHLAGAMALASAQSGIDAAVLDLNLGGDEVFPLADLLTARGVPLIFSTGYDPVSLPVRFADVQACVKPVSLSQVIAALQGVMDAR